MGANELRDSVKEIRMTDEMKRAVIENVKERTERSGTKQAVRSGSGEAKQNRDRPETVKTTQSRKKTEDRNRRTDKTEEKRMRHKSGWRRNLAAAVLTIAVIGAAAVPVRAFVNSIVKERMEEMPQEEKDTYVETLEEQEVEADGYTRAYTESEESRYQELARKYQEGTFPERAVTQVDSEEEAEAFEFCYLKPTSVFCLPERELTDEELLEIIDFIMKRDYAYSEEYAREHSQEIAEREEQQKTLIAGNVENGGITQQQAIEIATEKLYGIFGVTEDGFERNAYYNESEEGSDANYCVNWSNIISHQFYYFYIDAKDGHMTWALYSGSDVHDLPDITMEEAGKRIPELQAQAAEFMNSKIKESYSRVYVYYLRTTDGKASGDGVRFYFAKEDQSACAVTYTWDGMLIGVEECSLSDLEDGRERDLWNGEEYIKYYVVFQELDA